MKTVMSKRETVLTVITAISVVLVVVLSLYSNNLRAKNRSANNLAQGNAALLQQKDSAANKTDNYTETICAEYRKLYKAYTDLRSQHPSSGESYALPGSAKGQVDDCYLPE